MNITSFALGAFTGFLLPTVARLGMGSLLDKSLPHDVAIKIKSVVAVIMPAAASVYTFSDENFDAGCKIGLSANAFISGQAVGREVILIATNNSYLSNDRTLNEKCLAKLLQPAEAMMAVATIGLTYNWPPIGMAFSSLIGSEFGKHFTKEILNERQPTVILFL